MLDKTSYYLSTLMQKKLFAFFFNFLSNSSKKQMQLQYLGENYLFLSFCPNGAYPVKKDLNKNLDSKGSGKKEMEILWGRK